MNLTMAILDHSKLPFSIWKSSVRMRWIMCRLVCVFVCLFVCFTDNENLDDWVSRKGGVSLLLGTLWGFLFQ